MNSTILRVGRRLTSSCILSIFALSAAASAQEVQHLLIPQRGGMPGMPLFTGTEVATNGVVVTWDGPPGYYQLFRRVPEGEWQAEGPRTNLARRALLSTTQANEQFMVSGPAPHYAGSASCAECHQSTVDAQQQTPHAHAFESLVARGQQNNTNSLPSFTVGYNLPTGFRDISTTPHLAGVQCENCHGPAAHHAARPEDFTVKPRVDIAATVCGGCHSGTRRPIFEEWSRSAHAVVTEDMNPASRINSCGRCHSGSSRLALLKGEAPPSGDANMGITCAVCHDPHQNTGQPALLRNPLFSTNNYSLNTSDPLLAQYDPNVNICAQCHNDRGAAWTSSARPPHHSPQYNMLLGTVGQLAGGQAPRDPASHAFLEKQCVSCHMHQQSATGGQPGMTGHTFKVESYESCLECHRQPELLAEFVMEAIAIQIEDVKRALDVWATTKAPEALRVKYGARAWEYTSPGSLSTGGSGPTSAEQALIPDNIKKARFNVYIVLYDGSFGVHNGPYSVTLLNTALDWVQAELRK